MELRLRSQGQPELRRVSIFLRATLRALTVVGLPILVLAPFDGRSSPAPHYQSAPPVVPAPARPSELVAGTTLRSGEFLVSSNGRYRLDMLINGNLVLSWEGHFLWASHTAHHRGAVATMQHDGNFVIYQGRRAIWNSRTSRPGKRDYYLLVRPDGDVVIYTPAHKPTWETHTSVSGIRAFPSGTPESNDGSSTQASRIWSARLDANATAIAGRPTLLLYNDTSRFGWESTLDDPNLVSVSGRLVLVFSSGNWESAGYSEAYAACSGPSGPCHQPSGRPFLSSYGSVAGPAGGSLFTDSTGNWRLGYAGWSRSCTSYACGGARRLFTTAVDIAA